MALPSTLGELRGSEYRMRSVREELRDNLVDALRHGRERFQGLVGYQDTVIPQIENALLAGQDIVFLGERGQAKSRLIRAMAQLLDEQIPVVRGSEVHDHPYAPISRFGRDLVREQGDQTPVTWIGREDRFGEKLATPDTSIADLIGEVDPIRVAEGRYLADELTIHYGLLPRVNRGIFAINELPDLAERIQVGLLNVMEERDVQIRGFQVRLPLDVLVVATANPEDYTNRGRIITPLKDRFGSQIRTHYPRSPEAEAEIVEQERDQFAGLGIPLHVPQYMLELVAEISQLARRTTQINQRSGVSVRLSIANFESLCANAVRRAIALQEAEAVPRLSDLGALSASTLGKLELETWEEGEDQAVLQKLLRSATGNVFRRHFSIPEFGPVLARFEQGLTIEVGEMVPVERYQQVADGIPEMKRILSDLDEPQQPGSVAAALELVLEGLHLAKRLNKTVVDGTSVYGG
ncbi:MAG TPA: sigma 54-interacting transcriptional regulator [Candidatus Dormibacteraeota bacterium]|nr:sigma 54-interacting transcriptional regulator [Candidatus Dormibacteraeota bacterium]